jgi:2-isopropylmalate synthase
MFDAEHFFDGYKNNQRVMHWNASAQPMIVEQGGLFLCDTNGGTLPFEIEEIVHDVAKVIPGEI